MGEINEKLGYDEAVALGLDELYRRREEMANKEEIDANWNTIQNAISHLESLQVQKQAADERKQEIEEQKTAYQLPKDYSTLFGDHRANDEILHLVQETIDQVSTFYEDQLSAKDAENLAAIQKLHTAYEEDIAGLREEIVAFRAENETIGEVNVELGKKLALKDEALEVEQNAHAQTIIERDKLKGELAAAQLAAQDAIQKRDAAVRDAESYQAQIKELEQMVTKPKRATFSLNLTSSLEDKPIGNSRDAALRRMQEEYGIVAPIMPTIGGEQPEGESFRDEVRDSSEPTSDVQHDGSTTTNAQIQGEDVKPFPAADVDTTLAGVSSEAETNDRAVGFDAQAEIEKLKKRIDRLEERANIVGEVA